MLGHEHPGLAVGIPPGVVDQSAKATRVHRCVDAPTLPVMFEVVDITTERAWVPVVLPVSKCGGCHVDELSGIFHQKFAFLKRSGGFDAAALGAVIANGKALLGIG